RCYQEHSVQYDKRRYEECRQTQYPEGGVSQEHAELPCRVFYVEAEQHQHSESEYEDPLDFIEICHLDLLFNLAFFLSYFPAFQNNTSGACFRRTACITGLPPVLPYHYIIFPAHIPESYSSSDQAWNAKNRRFIASFLH